MPTKIATLRDYYAGLDAGDADACAALVAENVLVIRPALSPEGVILSGVTTLRGRVALRDYVAARGRRPFRHFIRTEVGDGRETFVEGVVRGDEPGFESLFMSSASLDDHGLIVRYLAVGTPVSVDDLAGLG